MKPALKLALLFVFLSCAPAHAERQSILVLGDSISAAYGMSVQQGWVALLARRLEHDHPDVDVINASISGETTVGGLRRLPGLLAQHKPDIVLLELGANDGLRGYPIDSLRKNLQKLVELSQRSGAELVMVQMEIPPNYGRRYTQAFHDSYTLISDNTTSILTPFILEGVAGNPSLIQADGLHPTVDAQPRLMANLLPTIITLLN